MLRINLLPVRQLQKQAKAKQELVILGGVLCLVVLALALVGWGQVNNIKDLNKTITDIENQEDNYAPILKRIADIKKKKLELQRKTEVINKLQQDSSLTVRVLDEVANSVDNSRMWLNALSQNGRNLQLSGIALDNRSISEFMDVLKASPYVTTVDLTTTSMQAVSGQKLKKFALSCIVQSPPKSAKNEETPKKS